MLSNTWIGVAEIYTGQHIAQYGFKASFEMHELGVYRTRREAERRLLIFKWVGR